MNNEFISDKDYSKDIDLDFKKLDEELCQSLNLLDENDNSTEVDSEEFISTTKPLLKKNKKFLVNNFLIINEDNINRTKIDVINKYYLLAYRQILYKQLNNNLYY